MSVSTTTVRQGAPGSSNREIALRLALLAFIGSAGASLLPASAYASDCACNIAACQSIGATGCCGGQCICTATICECVCCF